MYRYGNGVLQNDKEAVKWYRLAAEQGAPEAQHNLGFMYRYGKGVLQDDKEAVKWYRLAAEQGVVEAQFNTGVMYANGEGVPEDNVYAGCGGILLHLRGTKRLSGTERHCVII